MHSQKSYPQKLGTCQTTIKAQGCFLVSISNLINYLGISTMNPLELNEFLIQKGGYSNGCLMNAPKVASLLGMTYVKTNINPENLCVAETDHYKSKGVPQHFFLIRKDGKIVDPLDIAPDWKKNPYRVVSYRVFTRPSSPKIDPGEAEAPEVVSEPKQDETVPIPVTVAPVADPQTIAEKGIPYEPEKVEHWFILLIKDIINLFRK